MLLATHSWGRAAIPEVECGSKQAKGKGTDPKRHVEASVSKAKGREGPRMTFRFRSLSRWPRRQFFPRVLFGASPAVKGDHFVPADARLADGAHLAVGPGLQPLVQAGPTKQVPAQADHSILGRVEADVALKAAILLSSSRAAAVIVVRRCRWPLGALRCQHHTTRAAGSVAADHSTTFTPSTQASTVRIQYTVSQNFAGRTEQFFTVDMVQQAGLRAESTVF